MYNFICLSVGYLKTEHWPLKFWGHENFAKLAIELNRAGEKIALIGDKKDWKDAEQIIKMSADTANRIINLCGVSNDIRDVAAILQQAKLVVGSDGGLMHVSAAVDTPTVTIFNFTNPVKNRPFHDKGIEVMVPCDDRPMCQHGRWQKCRENGCCEVKVESVMEAVRECLLKLQ